MCGRSSITRTEEELEEIFGVAFYPNDVWRRSALPIYNASPGMYLPVRLNEDTSHFRYGHWGLQSIIYPEKQYVINARAESLFQKPSFKELIKTRRCLIPADGYYEWKIIGKHKVPYRVEEKNRAVFWLAGIFNTEREQNGHTKYTFCILTQLADNHLGNIHHRMPVRIAPNQVDKWLDSGHMSPQVFHTFLSQPMNDLHYYLVSDAVNKTSYNKSDLLLPIKKFISDQGRLF